jgi:putative spermidine/putrescine transport system ATP-binding protein
LIELSAQEAIEDGKGSAARLRDVTKRFGGTLALDRVSLDVKAGEIVSLLGPSGCGKTTCLRIIAGFEQPDNGTVFLLGADVSKRKVHERNVGLVFQDYALFPHMTVEENVAYGLRQRGWNRRDMPARVREMLTLVRLAHVGARRPSQLSGGQQQRIALARALATRPVVTLLDEPLSALDAQLRQALRVELRAILKAVGSTTILVTHDQAEAMSISDRVAVMAEGHVVQEGTPADVYNKPRTRYVAEFLGRANIFAGRLFPRQRDDSGGMVLEDGSKLAIAGCRTSGREQAELCVRAERISLGPASDSRQHEVSGVENRLHGVVDNVVQLGAEMEVRIRLTGGREIIVVEQNRGGPAWCSGDQVTARFSGTDCVLLENEPTGGRSGDAAP